MDCYFLKIAKNAIKVLDFKQNVILCYNSTKTQNI